MQSSQPCTEGQPQDSIIEDIMKGSPALAPALAAIVEVVPIKNAILADAVK